MASDKRRRIARLEQRLADEQCAWQDSRGLASLLAWDKAQPESRDEPSSSYGGIGLTQLLTLEERQ